MKSVLQMIPRYRFWRDVFPVNSDVKSFWMMIAIATLPFVGIAVLALVLDHYADFPVEIGVHVYEVGGGVLGLFLVLRTNAGYDRWWEARKLWGGITNQCRNLASAAIANSADAAWSRELTLWVILFAHASRRHLRGEADLPELARLLGPEAERGFFPQAHAPLQISMRIAAMLDDAARSDRLTSAKIIQMERERMSLVDHLGGCERILKTPLPAIYSTIIRQFILAFLVSFPFGILQSVTWLTPFVTAFVAFPMLALDEIGDELQNPFSADNFDSLPLDAICGDIEASLMAVAACDAASTVASTVA